MNPRTFAGVMTLAIALSACDGAPRSPTAPTPPPPPPPSATYALSGTVSEMTASGRVPIEGAQVTETNSGRTATTSANGRFAFTGLPTLSRSVSVTKAGFVTAIQSTIVTGDTELDIRLVRIESYTLSGVVFEMTEAGRTPIESVEIYCDSCGSPVGHTFVDTDANGFYSLGWTANGVHPLFVTKAGYVLFDPTGRMLDTIGRIPATVNGDTRFDIQLVRR